VSIPEVRSLNLILSIGVAALFPFFTLHMKALGISVTEMAWMLLLLPIVSSIGPPLGGALADRLGNYKLVLIIFTIISVVLHMMLWFAVPGFGTHMVTSSVLSNGTEFVVRFPCSADGTLPAVLHLIAPPSGEVLQNCLLTNQWSAAEISDCVNDCSGVSGDSRICFTAAEGRRTPDTCFDWRDIETFLVSEVAVRNQSGGGSKAPTGGTTTVTAMTSTAATNMAKHRPLKSNNTMNVLSWNAVTFSAPGLSLDVLRNGHCSSNRKTECVVSCNARSENQLACQKVTVEKYGDRLTTLTLYFTFRFLSFTAMRVVFPLLDAALLEITKEHKGDFGIQRLFGSVGFVLVRTD
jgi:hypothetical protein